MGLSSIPLKVSAHHNKIKETATFVASFNSSAYSNGSISVNATPGSYSTSFFDITILAIIGMLSVAFL